MVFELAQLLQTTVDGEFRRLSAMTEEAAAAKADGKWSRKQELGHLIDSASNNHLRFVRAALEPQYQGPGYDQNGCVELHGYQNLPWSDLVEFWRRYNLLLVKLVSRIPDEKLGTACRIADGPEVTLGFVIEDYVRHMKHHLDHILRA
jgi:hypothetical protein